MLWDVSGDALEQLWEGSGRTLGSPEHDNNENPDLGFG